MSRRQQSTLSYAEKYAAVRVCKCGCGERVDGKKIFFNAACRKRIQRLTDRLQSKQKKTKPTA